MCGVRVKRARRVCLGGLGWLSHARSLSSAFFIFGHTLSERCGIARHVSRHASPRHATFAYCKSPNGWRVGSPVGQYSSLVLRQSMSGTARLFPHRLVSSGLHALAETRPLGHSPAFPHPDKRHVYFVDSFIVCTSRSNEITHTLAPVRSHPQWLAILSITP